MIDLALFQKSVLQVMQLQSIFFTKRGGGGSVAIHYLGTFNAFAFKLYLVCTRLNRLFERPAIPLCTMVVNVRGSFGRSVTLKRRK